MRKFGELALIMALSMIGFVGCGGRGTGVSQSAESAGDPAKQDPGTKDPGAPGQKCYRECDAAGACKEWCDPDPGDPKDPGVCKIDADCKDGAACEIFCKEVPSCDGHTSEECFGTCAVPAPPSCTADSDCKPGLRCDLVCKDVPGPSGTTQECFGQCVP